MARVQRSDILARLGGDAKKVRGTVLTGVAAA